MLIPGRLIPDRRAPAQRTPYRIYTLRGSKFHPSPRVPPEETRGSGRRATVAGAFGENAGCFAPAACSRKRARGRPVCVGNVIAASGDGLAVRPALPVARGAAEGRWVAG